MARKTSVGGSELRNLSTRRRTSRHIDLRGLSSDSWLALEVIIVAEAEDVREGCGRFRSEIDGD